MTKRLWTPKDLAAFLGVSTKWVSSHRKEIPSIQFTSRTRRFDPESEAFQNWLKQFALPGRTEPSLVLLKQRIDSESLAS